MKKKKIIDKICSALLSFTLLFSLTACDKSGAGGSDGNGDSNGDGSSGGSNVTMREQILRMAFTFTTTWKRINTL